MLHIFLLSSSLSISIVVDYCGIKQRTLENMPHITLCTLKQVKQVICVHLRAHSV